MWVSMAARSLLAVVHSDSTSHRLRNLLLDAGDFADGYSGGAGGEGGVGLEGLGDFAGGLDGGVLALEDASPGR